MTPLLAALAGLSVLTLLALVVAVTALWQVRSVVRKQAQYRREEQGERDSALAALRADLDSVTAEVHESPPVQIVPASFPRNGLNLAKRTQALRLNRHGSSPAQIASALDVPLQEVELLLKVDRIVLSNL